MKMKTETRRSTNETTKICRSPSSAVIRFSGLNCIKRRNKSNASSDAPEIRLSNDFFGLKKNQSFH